MLDTVNPRQTVLVTSRGKAELLGKKVIKDNIITLDWHMPASFNPMLYVIAVGKGRFSRELIEESGVFVVNFVPFDMKDAAVFCGRNSGRHIDKYKETGLEMEEAEKVECGRIRGAIGYIECRVAGKTAAGDHILFLGEVLGSSVKDGKRLFHMSGDSFTTTI